MKLQVKFIRDIESAKKFLNPRELTTFKIKSKIILTMLKTNFPSKEVTDLDNGFMINIEKPTKEEIEQQKQQMDNLMLNSTPPQPLTKMSNEPFFRLMKRKYKQFSTKLFLKATKKHNVLSLLNMMGIMVEWKIKK